MRVSLLALRYSPRWRSRILSGVSSLTAITAPSLFKRLDESRAPSLRWHYPASSVPLRPSDFSPACPGFRLPLYRAIAAITRDERDLPRYPVQLPSHAVPTTPESPSAPVSVVSTDGGDLPHLTTGSALSISKSRGSMGSLVVRPASLLFSLQKFSRST